MPYWKWPMINLLSFFISLNIVNSSEQNLQKRPLAARSNQCQLCHIKRKHQEIFIPQEEKTKREHFEIELSHGNLKRSCNDCHDVNNSNKLFAPATFANTSPVCARCHIEHYTQWQKGIHGKKVGSWKNMVSYHCIDCHNPHAVSIKKIQSRPPPIFLRQK